MSVAVSEEKGGMWGRDRAVDCSCELMPTGAQVEAQKHF